MNIAITDRSVRAKAVVLLLMKASQFDRTRAFSGVRDGDVTRPQLFVNLRDHLKSIMLKFKAGVKLVMIAFDM